MTIWPLSLWQSHALELEQRMPGFTKSPWFTMNAVVELTGRLDVSRLAAAVDRLQRRHEVLRTEVTEDGQVVSPGPGTGLELDDEGDRTHVPVPLDSPVRIRLTRTGPVTHLLSLHVHHLVCDPATLWILLADLGALYAARAGGPAPDPVVRFGEYVVAEAEQVRRAGAAARTWWGRTIGDADLASISGELVGPAFAYREEVLSAQEFARAERAFTARRSTPLVSLLAAISDGMAAHVDGGGTFAFTTIFSKRDRPRWQRMAGPCMVASYLAVPVTDDHRLVRDAVLGCATHARFPADAIRALNPGIAAKIIPFFEYITQQRPEVLGFGAVTGRVVTAAGPKDVGAAKELGIRLRRTNEGALHGHFSADGRGWSETATREVTARLRAHVTGLAPVTR